MTSEAAADLADRMAAAARRIARRHRPQTVLAAHARGAAEAAEAIAQAIRRAP